MNIQKKLDEIYSDFEYNVTGIYGRRNLHLAIDLVYHSPLSFYLGRQLIEKGFPEVLILGDTRCGKTETAKQLVRHYRLGSIATGEGATRSGLVGGNQTLYGTWATTWGKIPLNDRRLLFIDEASGLSEADFAQMSGVRSSCIAEITQIKTSKTRARTRLIWMSNPRSGANINNFSSGVQAIKALIGKSEDIARFDFAVVLSKEDVSDDVINSFGREEVEHRYTSELCNNLILWAWSRKTHQIEFEKSALNACFVLSRAMYKKYSSNFPLVTSSEQKIKLAKMSVALAARLFSHGESPENILVRAEHVEYIVDFLCQEYDRPEFGYDIWSRKQIADAKLRSVHEVGKIVTAMGGDDMARILLDTTSFTVKTVEEFCDATQADAKTYVSQLLHLKAVKSYKGFYSKTPAFVRFLKDYVSNPDDIMFGQGSPKVVDDFPKEENNGQAQLSYLK